METIDWAKAVYGFCPLCSTENNNRYYGTKTKTKDGNTFLTEVNFGHMERVKAFIKKDIVLCVAVVLAIVSAFFVTPDAKYIDYIDFRTLSILFSLMCVMAGLNELGLFKKIAEGLLDKASTVFGLSMCLVLMCFFFSMLITNDVALITFVPFTFTAFMMLPKDKKDKYIIPVIVFETIAANLGSMLTPVGNPQNLYLYGKSGMSFSEFIMLMLPYSFVSLVLLVVSIAVLCKNDINKQKSDTKTKKEVVSQGGFSLTLTELFAKSQTSYHSKLIMYIMLFIVSMLVVLKLIPYQIMLIFTLVLVFLADRTTLKKVDYSLLITFVGFFIFIGNMGRISAVSSFLASVVKGHEVLTAVVSSQAISNVPAALLLSGFSDNYRALIVGTDLGGLGTLIASMASLISYKMVAAKEDISTGRYFTYFTVANIVFLIILSLAHIIIGII